MALLQAFQGYFYKINAMDIIQDIQSYSYLSVYYHKWENHGSSGASATVFFSVKTEGIFITTISYFWSTIKNKLMFVYI